MPKEKETEEYVEKKKERYEEIYEERKMDIGANLREEMERTRRRG